MPWPISAGVFGIARTTRSLPVAATSASVRMPAINRQLQRARQPGLERRHRLGEQLRLDGPDDGAGAAEALVARGLRRHAEFGGELAALRLVRLHHPHLPGGRAGAQQPADDGAGHVAAADECDHA